LPASRREDLVEVVHGVAIADQYRWLETDDDPRVVEWVAATAADLGHTVRRLPSGAGHDAQMLARVCPAGMIFVPSVGGISHNPAEHTEPSHLDAGADTLLQTLLGITGIASVGGHPVGPGWEPVLDHSSAPEDR